MANADVFAAFIQRIRTGDEQAAEELVRRFEPLIRREVRLRLRDPRLYRQFESLDICQSVLASFFLRTAAGQFELDHPEQLVKLLVAMAGYKLAHLVRLHRARRRDHRRLEPVAEDWQRQAVAHDPSPSRVVAGRELLEAFHQRLSEEERALVDLRAQGCAWAEIATKLGGSPDARRMQLARAVDRVERELLGDDSPE